jgi:YidC/Oxa1 family membrane protein insertase
MNSQRNLLLIALVFVSVLLFQQWQTDYTVPHQTTTPSAITEPTTADLPTATTTDLLTLPSDNPSNHWITVQSDLLSIAIDLLGGDIVQAQLLAYPHALQDPRPLSLLEYSPPFLYQAQSGLIGPQGPDSQASGRPLYQASQQHYQIAESQDSIEVPLVYRNDQGVEFRKTFVLRRGDYALEVRFHIDNSSTHPLCFQLFGQLKQSVDLPKARNKGHFALQTYRGAAYSTPENRYQKYSFSDLKKTDLALSTQRGWVALLQQYFVSAWIPEENHPYQFYTKNLPQQQQALIGFKGELITLLPGQQQQLQAKLWLGPELQEKMASVVKYLDLTVDYGWLWFISQPLFKLLKFLHRFVGNWGAAIICITFVVRGLLYPLTKAQYTAMAKMRLLQPKLVAMRERCGDDRQRLSREMMDLYKREQVNPLGGCLPLLVQMPIFLALYWMLMGSVELRHAPFIGWIRDLSAPDPYYVLPLLMGLSMFLIQKMSPSPVTDPMQQKVMTFMPVIFTIFFLWFPSGLVLYYVISNLMTLLQQQLIMHQLDKKGLQLQ